MRLRRRILLSQLVDSLNAMCPRGCFQRYFPCNIIHDSHPILISPAKMSKPSKGVGFTCVSFVFLASVPIAVIKLRMMVMTTMVRLTVMTREQKATKGARLRQSSDSGACVVCGGDRRRDAPISDQ